MKSYRLPTIFILICVVFLLFSCKKSDVKESVPAPVPGNGVSYSLDSLSTVPGLFVTVRSNANISADTLRGIIDNISITMTKVDSIHYAFMVPVLAPGSHTLTFTNNSKTTNLNLEIRSYPVIKSPDDKINLMIKNYNALANSLLIDPDYAFVKSSTVQFMHEIMAQLAKSVTSLTPNEKLLLAYQIQSSQLDNVSISSMNLGVKNSSEGELSTSGIKSVKISSQPLLLGSNQGTSSYKTMLGVNDIFSGSEYCAIAILKAIKGREKMIIALSWTVPAGAAINLFATSPPGPAQLLAAPIVLLTLGKVITATIEAIKANDDAIKNIGILISSELDNPNGFGTSTNPLLVSDNSSFVQPLEASFRSITKTDASGLSPEFTDYFKAKFSFFKKYTAVTELFTSLRNKFSTYFDQITAATPSELDPTPETPLTEKKPLITKFLSVSNISNPNISITISEDQNGSKLTFTNPNKTITSTTPFTFQLKYNQAAINKTGTITETAKYTVSNAFSITTTPATSITSTSAISGGNIINDGGSAVTARGVCWSVLPNTNIQDKHTTDGIGIGSFTSNITGLTPNLTYYVRAYATNSTGTIYGTEVNFKAQGSADSSAYYRSKIIGKWRYLKYVANTNDKLNGDFAEMIYKADGTMSATDFDGSKLGATWSISGNTLKLIDASDPTNILNWPIVKLNDTDFVFIDPDGVDSKDNPLTITFYFVKVP